jgi:hypothetical protein
MSQQRPVPRLDLAPKLKRPLSLWNPLDYLRLLYWVFFFPQALRWYVDTFGGGYIPLKQMTRQQGCELLRQNSIQPLFLFQGLMLTIVAPVSLGVIVLGIGVPLDWSRLAVGIAIALVISLALSLVGGVAVGMAVGVVMGGVFGLAFGVADRVTIGLALGVTLCFELNLLSCLRGGVGLGVGLDAGLGIGLGVGGSVTLGIASGLALGVAGGIAGGIAGGVVILRPDNWLLGLPLTLLPPWNRCCPLSCTTPLPIPFLTSRLTNSLRWDWQTGLQNVNHLLIYTRQFIPVIQAVNRTLARTASEQVISRVSQLAESPYDWGLVFFASASLSGLWNSSALKGLLSFPPHWRQRFQAGFVADTRLDTPARAAAAGFWHLHEKKAAKAMEAFAVVRSLPYGEEMFILAQSLATFHYAKEPVNIAALQVPASPKEPLLRPAIWETITSLGRVIENVQVVQRIASRSARAFALNRALGELQDILNKADTLPQAEQGLIIDIAQTWQKALLQVAGEVGKLSITNVSNPYLVGDPVQGNLFVGQEDVLRQLEELWVMGHQLQSVVLYGHRRMGKTSILLNATNCLGAGVQIAYVNLLRLGDCPQGVEEVLMAISDAISEAVSCTPPTDADLLNLPYRTFERYLKQVEVHLNGGLIVALDEFEKIEELIEAEKIPKDFMGYLRGLVQMSSKVAFAFAGLHTLEEMTADYFQPFFASVIPIHVDFLAPGATHQILANPDEEFPLDYTPEALDQIYTLTAGQPYLVQLVGFQLVRRYNDYVFEQGRPRDPVFTVEDVEAVINDPEFFKRGRYYFDGVWGQAARGAFGQQAILRALAPHPEGLSIEELRTQFNEILRAHVGAPLLEGTLQDALNTLTRHDVIKQREGRWLIIVELFRRWVVQN